MDTLAEARSTVRASKVVLNGRADSISTLHEISLALLSLRKFSWSTEP